ncbi:MAG: hypothetical protein R3F61_37265 [Myxococcota bacterium]
MILALVCAALAAIPEGVRPAAAPADAPAQYEKAFPRKPGLACAPLLPEHALLCFRVWEGQKRRWVTVADLTAWQTDLDALVSHVTKGAQKVLENEPTAQKVVDMDAVYHDLRDGDGWAVAPLVAGSREKLVRVAIPSTGVFLTWEAGSPELDRVMAVGVREIYEASEDAVTPMVHVWRDGRFVPFVQAKPTGG